MKKSAAIFLNGTYPPESRKFYVSEYKKAIRKSVVIAADGALIFFKNNGLVPHLILGDWDSADYPLKKEYPDAKIISIPEKNKQFTDGEYALQWCKENDIVDIVIYGGIDTNFETDHLLGNIFMMFAYLNDFKSIRMHDYVQEIIPIVDGVISGEGKAGDNLSIIPFSNSIRYKARGLKYNPLGRKYSFGSSTPLRNQIKNKKFRIEIKGKAFIVRHFGKN